MHSVCRWLAVCGIALSATQDLTVAAEPLHSMVDRLVAARFAGQSPAPQADDGQFLRRIWLDLAGSIPSAEQTRRFLDDASSDKRAREIDRLLAAPSYPDRMENLFHVMLMERRGDDPEWRKFLRTSFEENRPWDQIVRTILAPDDQDETTRGSAFFYTKRLEKYGQNPTDFAGLTRDVGRLFLGIDLQCAECHNHLFVDDYKQLDFQGLFAVYKNVSIRKGKFPAVNEKAMAAKLEFVSVFDPTQRKTGPRIPFGKEFTIPEPPKESEKQDGKKKGEQKPDGPTFSPLALIAQEMPVDDNELFTRNAVNRLWFLMMGRGLVEPLDMFHSANPASHPELLKTLAREFAAQDFDVKWFLRELALCETYQRSSRMPQADDSADFPAPQTYQVALEKRISAEQLFWSVLEATGNRERLSEQKDGKPSEDFTDLKERFLKAFANEPREPEVGQDATVKAALFLLNDDKFLELLKPQRGNLMERLLKTDALRQLTDELFLSVFTRRPADDERAAVIEYLQQNEDRRETALRHVAWGMLTSMEFCANH